MKDLMKKYRVALALVLYPLILGGLFYLVINKIVSRINAVNDEMEMQALTQQNKHTELADVPKMEQQSSQIASKKEMLDAMLLNKNDAVKLIEQLEDLAKQSNVGITISVDESQVDQKPKTTSTTKAGVAANPTVADFLPSKNYLKFSLALDGSFDDMLKFISKVENIAYYDDIISFNIKQNVGKETSSGANPFGDSPVQKFVGSKNTAAIFAQNGDILGTLVVIFYLK